ncbi:hypothetical protein VM1G_11736 [Cytospora mali]|uniref:Uncharacterized protein n=1 Tax=Cytospora mali TaxID=578113 RepID=A0A194W6K0_CYTMA|nr:hypothetical protein VM1G_11736 [Valsa mali]
MSAPPIYPSASTKQVDSEVAKPSPGSSETSLSTLCTPFHNQFDNPDEHLSGPTSREDIQDKSVSVTTSSSSCKSDSPPTGTNSSETPDLDSLLPAPPTPRSFSSWPSSGYLVFRSWSRGSTSEDGRSPARGDTGRAYLYLWRNS